MYHRWAIFAVTSLLFLLSQFYRASNAVLAPHLIRDLALNAEGLGLLSAVFFYAFALMQIPLGLLLDRIGPRRTMTILSFIAVIGALIFAWANSLAMGVLGRVLMGVGMAGNLMGTFKLLTIWFAPSTFAILSGFTFSVGNVGNMVATTPLVMLVQALGWRWGFSLIAGINLVLAVILYLVARDSPPANSRNPILSGPAPRFADIISGLRLLLQKRDYWIISCGSFFRYGVFAAVQVLWGGPYLMQAMGLSALQAGNLLLLLNTGLIIGGPFWGTLSDKGLRRRKGVVVMSLVIFSIAMFAMAMMPLGTSLSVLALLFFSFGFAGGVSGVMFAHIKELMPIRMAGVAMTGINFFTMFGAAVFLQGLGSLMQHLYPNDPQGIDAFNGAFLFSAACLAVATLLYLFTRETRPDQE